MKKTHEGGSARALILFLLRNMVLSFLLVSVYLQLRDELDLIFQGSALLLGVLLALWMEKGRLRFTPAFLIACILPFALRAVFFLVFRLQRAAAPGQETDFLFLLFDKDFGPALVPYGIAWLFNFLALRRGGFAFMEVGLNSLLLVLAYWSQAGYSLTIFPHPSIYANFLALFVLAELFVLLLAWLGELRAKGEGQKISLRSLLSFSWILLPLLLIFLFFLLGKYSEGAVKAGGGLMKPTLFRFDFSPFIRLESEIKTSDEEVLLFRTQGRAERWLLKRFVLSGYDPNRGFFLERGKGIDEYPTTVPDSPQAFPDPRYRDRMEVDQEYFFLNLDPSSLIALDYPLQVIPLTNWKSSSFLRVYRVDSKVSRSEAQARKVAAEPSMPADALSYYTKSAGDAEIQNLARDITARESTYFRKVKALETYLKTNYLYSLKPGIAEDGNQLRHFLFKSKKGYCSYFAFAMALMARSLGIPARVAVGFYVDPRMEVLNFYEVRAFQAHAWVEVWFGDLGWIEFDPTSENLAPGEDFSFFMGPDKDRLSKLIQEILANQDQMTEAQAQPLPPSVPERVVTEISRVFLFVARLWYVTLPLLYALILLSLKLFPSLPGLLLPERRRKARSLYRLSLALLHGAGIARSGRESPEEYARRVEDSRGIAFLPLTDAYLKSVFADVFDAADLADLRRYRSAFLSSYRAAVNPAIRFLGLLNPLGVPRLSLGKGGRRHRETAKK
jgi:transglutaminase-like putative cysteine protease